MPLAVSRFLVLLLASLYSVWSESTWTERPDVLQIGSWCEILETRGDFQLESGNIAQPLFALDDTV